MKIFRLPDRLDRMPMLKILVFFAAGIALAGRYELPLWFLAGAFVVTGVLAVAALVGRHGRNDPHGGVRRGAVPCAPGHRAAGRAHGL